MITVAGTQHDPHPQIRTLERFIGRDIPVTVTAYNRDKVAWEVARQHRYCNFPVVYCTDPDGNVFHSWSGYDPEEIDQAIEGRFYDSPALSF